MTRRAMRWGVTPLVMAAILLTGGANARSDVCADCGPPTTEDLQQDPGFKVEKRGWGVPDEVHLHAGECHIQFEGAPRIEKQLGYLVLRGSGAVWTCPSSTASDTMTATVTETDSKDWGFSASSSVGASVLGVGLSAEVVATVREASSVQAVTSISKEMKAGYCYVIAWEGYFEVAEYTADVTFTVERRFGWWTKNILTGDTVHRSGEVWISCGTHEATLEMRAPIKGYFKLSQSPCPDPQCKAVPVEELGWFPPLPPGLVPPVTPGDGPGEGEAPPPDEEAPDEVVPDEVVPDDGDDDEPEPEPVPVPDPEADDDEPVPVPVPVPVPDPQADDDEVPSSDELGDPPTGPLPDPLGIEPTADEETQP